MPPLPETPRKKRLLALVCRVCPFCAVARLIPNSAYARKLREVETNCPACRAYREVYEKPPTGGR